MNWLPVLVSAMAGGLGSLLGILLASPVKSPPKKRLVMIAGILGGFLLTQLVAAPWVERWGARQRVRRQAPASWSAANKDVFVEEMSPLLQGPELEAWRKRNPPLDTKAAAALSARGFARLSDAEIEQVRGLKHLLGSKSAALCQAFWTGNLQPEVLYGAMQQHLSAAQIRTWLRVGAHATMLEIEGRVPPRPIPAEGFSEVLASLAERMDTAERAWFLQTLQQGLQAPATDGCRAFLILGTPAATLDANQRALLARAFVSPQLIEPPPGGP